MAVGVQFPVRCGSRSRVAPERRRHGHGGFQAHGTGVFLRGHAVARPAVDAHYVVRQLPGRGVVGHEDDSRGPRSPRSPYGWRPRTRRRGGRWVRRAAGPWHRRRGAPSRGHGHPPHFARAQLGRMFEREVLRGGLLQATHGPCDISVRRGSRAGRREVLVAAVQVKDDLVEHRAGDHDGMLRNPSDRSGFQSGDGPFDGCQRTVADRAGEDTYDGALA
ncbi:hypothetical protein AHiyo8_11020 [Arthrobacter sp. Hiyo8]|nr:hypothetical protein AHiyo8_11020 [Arthrobacter sp. Hiyo8]